MNPSARPEGGEQAYEFRQDPSFSFADQSRARQIAALLSCVFGVGFLYQTLVRFRDRDLYPPPGRLYPVDGRQLHLQVAGESAPTVILESGLAAMSSAWGWIQPEVARFCRVVAYDRAGLGWSEADPSPLSAGRSVARLHAALQAADIPPPYVLVGHSMGGLLVRFFAHNYPEEVRGMVLLDASHPDQHLRSPAIGIHMATGFRLLNKLPFLAAIGYVRLAGLFNSWVAGLPPRQAAAGENFLCSYRHLQTTRGESLVWEQLCAEVRQARPLGDLPLAVVTAGKDVLPGQPELQAELAVLSSDSTHLVVGGADHVTLLTNRDHADKVVEVIRQVVEKAGGWG